MAFVLDLAIIQEPQRGTEEDQNAWNTRCAEVACALGRHLVEVLDEKGKFYDLDDKSFESLSWLPGALRFTVDERFFVPDFQMHSDGLFRTIVGDVNAHFHHVRLPWRMYNFSFTLWWLTAHPTLGCAPYELLDSSRDRELIELARSMGSRR